MLAGDSLTAGYGSSDGLGYRRRLAERLNAAGVTYVFTALATEHGGTLADRPGKPGLASKLPALQAQEKPDLIVIAIGTNDAAANAMAGFETIYRAMVQGVVDRDPDVRVVVVQVAYSRPAWAVRQVDIAVAVIHTWWWTIRTPVDRVLMADWTPVHGCKLGDDGVHPYDDGYDDMADALYSQIAPAMGWPALTYRWYRPPVRRPGYDRPAAMTC